MTHPHHYSMVLEYSCFLMTNLVQYYRKAKSVSRWGRVAMALPPLTPLLPACASEQGNVIGSVRIYIYIYIYVCTKKNCN